MNCNNTMKCLIFTFFCAIMIISCVDASLHVKVKYPLGPDVPKGETLLCRYPKKFDSIAAEIDLTKQQRGDMRCELKHFLETQRPCDFRKVNRYKLVTITLKGQYAHDDIRCSYNPKTDSLHIEDATVRDEPVKVKFNIYTVKP
uniref:CSON002998 protein n=1 Tax=Culicoides sonorensis TaxID=179676 RepID=A0A336LW25_CULSO